MTQRNALACAAARPRGVRQPTWLRCSRVFKVEYAVQALSLAGGLILWEILGWMLALPWLPPFSKVLTALVELIRNGEILANLMMSLRSLAVGFIISLVVGLVVGVLMGLYKRVDQAIGIYVNALLFTPHLVFAPIFFCALSSLGLDPHRGDCQVYGFHHHHRLRDGGAQRGPFAPGNGPFVRRHKRTNLSAGFAAGFDGASIRWNPFGNGPRGEGHDYRRNVHSVCRTRRAGAEVWKSV